MEDNKKIDTNEQPEMNESKKDETNKRLRDEKGHFISSKKKDGATEKAQADNVVKIKVIKDKEPLPPRSFEGKLEDARERTATNFIKSVIRRKPSKISIDGEVYYSEAVYDDVKCKLDVEKESSARGIAVLQKSMETILKTEKCLEVSYDTCQRLRQSKFWWRNIAITAIIMFLTSIGTMIWLKCYQENNVETSSEVSK